MSSLSRDLVILPQGSFFFISHLCPLLPVQEIVGRRGVCEETHQFWLLLCECLCCCCYSGVRSSREALRCKADLRLPSWRSQSVHLLQCALPGWQDCARGAGAICVTVVGKMCFSETWRSALHTGSLCSLWGEEQTSEGTGLRFEAGSENSKGFELAASLCPYCQITFDPSQISLLWVGN